MRAIDEIAGLTPEQFRDMVVPAARPLVVRGLVADWPVVAAGRKSGAALGDYLMRFDRGRQFGAMVAPPRAGGRFFYNDSLTGFNFRRQSVKLDAAFDFLLRAADEAEPPAFAIQSAKVSNGLPGFDADNPMPLLPPEVEPRVWIGNRATVAAHHDPNENIACVVAGRRRFTLFPPDQIGNLYLGPMERTPAGTVVSMIDFDAPDLEAHPRFAEAIDAALVAELGPGDALYIPYMWWHHVRALDAVNMLVNYWWGPPKPDASHPMDALLHAMLALRHLPEAHRMAWRNHFDHFVFAGDDAAGAHLPAERRGMLASLDEEGRRAVREGVQRGLDRK